MSLSGNLEDVSVADALQFIHLGGRTGTLELQSGGTVATIAFHQGRIVNAWGPSSKRLGDLLVSEGVLDRATLNAALKAQEAEQPRRSLGQVLISGGALAPEVMYRAIEQQIEKTVYELVTWTQGTFHFTLDEVRPIDDIAVVPGDVIRHLNLDTQMVLLDALRIFDERNRGGPREGPSPPPPAPASPQRATPTPAQELPPVAARSPTPAQGVATLPARSAPEAAQEKVRLQVVSADKHIAEKLAQSLPEVNVARVGLREAGTPPPGEPPPIVLLDLRGAGVALDAVAALRRARPRASILAIVDGGVPVLQVYQAGAMSAVPGELPLLIAAFRSLADNRRDLITGGARADRLNDSFQKLRRIVGDLRSGLISTTISLSLMNIISESVERAVLFLVRRDGLVALGAFGNNGEGKPLAQVTRGLKLALSDKNALTESLDDGQVRALPFDEAAFPQSLASVLGKPRSGQCAVFPVLGGQRVIALVYADNGHSNRAIEELDILELAAAQAGLAFENELLRRQAGQPQ